MATQLREMIFWSRTMGLEYINRRGDRYFAVQGVTKTGKPKYHATRKLKGAGLGVMPEGYEFYEHPEQGIVTIRKIVPSQITEDERHFLEEQTRSLAGIDYFIVSVQGDSLVIHLPPKEYASSRTFDNSLVGMFLGSEDSIREVFAKSATYLAMLRFTLVDADRRLFSVERWCFRGQIDDWIFLESGKPLAAQVKKFVPHLNKESFYELI